MPSPGRLLPFAFVAAALTSSGCKPRELPIVPLEELCETAEYGSTVRTAGFLTSPGGSMICDESTCEMALSNRGIGGTTSIRIDIRTGRGNNRMEEPPDRFSISDLVVINNEGVERRPGDWVVVQGRILNEMACLITPVSWVLPGEPPSGPAAAPAAAPANAAEPAATPSPQAPAAQQVPAPASPPQGAGDANAGAKPGAAPPPASAKP